MCCLSERRKSAYLAGEWLSGVLGFPVLPVPRRPSPPFCLGIDMWTCFPGTEVEASRRQNPCMGSPRSGTLVPTHFLGSWVQCWPQSLSYTLGLISTLTDPPPPRINSLLSFCASCFQSVPRSKSHVLWDFIKGTIQITSLIKFRSVISCLHPKTPSKESILSSFSGWWSKSYGAELRWPCTEMSWNEQPILLNSVYL